MAESKNIFAERLEKLIKENNYTHENVANGIDVTRQAVGKWVKGDSVPDVLTAAKLAEFFKVSVDYLAGTLPHRTPDKELSDVCEYTGLSEEAVKKIKQSSFEWALSELLETELAESGIISLILEYTTNAPTCSSGKELILSKNGDIRFVEGDVDVHDGFYFSDYNALHDRTVMSSFDIYNTFMLNLINDRLSILKNKTHKEIIEMNAKAEMEFLKQREKENQDFLEANPNCLVPIEETDLGKALQAEIEKEASNNAKHNPKKE